MKFFYIIICLLIASNVFCQTEKGKVIFKTTEYNHDKSISSIKYDTLIYNKNCDIEFYRNSFYKPFYFPEKVIDTNYRNQTITIWRDTTKAHDDIANWSHTYVYDGKSRIVEYSYSCCMVCSNMPFHYYFSYDQNNRIIRMENKMMWPFDTEKSKLLNDVYSFSYDSDGNVNILRYFNNDILQLQIEKISTQN